MSQGIQSTRTLVSHGQNIFIYGHVSTNQIIYSLTRAINNNSALKQLPYLGKKTKPAVIRKDLWKPIATVSFPSATQGLLAYRQLREFRRRHEHEWDLDTVRNKSRKLVARELRDQKANSIADLAAVLEGQEKIAQIHTEEYSQLHKRVNSARDLIQKRIPVLMESMRRLKDASETELRMEYKKLKAEKMRLRRATRSQNDNELVSVAEKVQRSIPSNIFTFPKSGRKISKSTTRFSVDGIQITWANILDAEYAKTWPKAIMHTSFDKSRGPPRHASPKLDVQISDISQAPASSSSVSPLSADSHEVESPQKHINTHSGGNFLQKLAERLKFGTG